MTRSSLIVASLLALSLTAPAIAQRVRLDDSPSPQQMYSLDLHWRPHEIGRAIQAMFSDQPAALPPLSGYLPGVDIRLNTRDFVGQRVRIYLTLPVAIAGVQNARDIEISWHTRGQFLAGSLRPGHEALVFEGVIEQPVTVGVFDFVLAVEPGNLADSFVFEPHYELEVTL